MVRSTWIIRPELIKHSVENATEDESRHSERSRDLHGHRSIVNEAKGSEKLW